ncbi:hypothetical protein [Marinomonas flavescens]|uniref:hypothetical protein n=1 Tax=Marinomonas flavescens TaxID=2529379 RepID=UPI0014049150|nr:hypothetical protein [Marinomonas flavescens]
MKMLPDDLPNDVDSLKALLLEQSLLLGKKDDQLAEWASKYERILGKRRLNPT